MDEQRREVLLAELDDAVRQRDDLDTYIGALAKRLGVDPPIVGRDQAAADGRAATMITGDVVAGVREGQFYGLSGPKAAKALLALVGRDRPLKTQEIFEAIRKGGVTQIASPNTLYRSLTRDPGLHNVGRGRWGLMEWYPSAKRKGSDARAFQSFQGQAQSRTTEAAPADAAAELSDISQP